MKKIALISLMTLGVSLALLMLLSTNPASGSGKASPAGPGTALPDSVKTFVQNACMDCHADDGNMMAKGKVNFSNWESYDAEKQAKKAQAICKEVGKKAMPPSKWQKNNPDRVPTQAQIDMICRWAASLQK